MGEHVDLADELIEQRSAFLVGRRLPDGIPMELGEKREHAFELVDAGRWFLLWFTLPLERGKLSADSQIFGVEAFRSDSVGVVQREQLPSFGFELAESAVPFRLAPAGVLAAARPALQAGSDRGLQFTVVSNQPQAENRASKQSLV